MAGAVLVVFDEGGYRNPPLRNVAALLDVVLDEGDAWVARTDEMAGTIVAAIAHHPR